MNLQTRVRSTAMRIMTSDALRSLRRGLPALKRRLSGAEPRVHYFHQVDDPYSHLAVQKLGEIESRYRLAFSRHLVRGPAAAYQGSPEKFDAWAVRDARSVAGYYGVTLPEGTLRPEPESVFAVCAQLAGLLDSDRFVARARELGEALWRGEVIGTSTSSDAAAAAGRSAREALDDGDALLKRHGHYLGAMFHFEGEWYWGLDRLYHLERRLRGAGFDTRPADPPCVPRPSGISASGAAAANVTLEYFPSLRSPYTAISYARTMDLVDRSGVTLRLRPVMPMMMRGVPAPQAKQFYIITDTKREAEAVGVPFGKVVDPFGDPVRLAFSLYPTLERLGKGREYLGSYLSAAFAEGIDITRAAGLAQVVERIGVAWSECAAALGTHEYEAVVENNVQALSEAGLWGVPSFRVSGGAGNGTFQCWGQDRLWRVETEIALRAGRTE